MITMKTRAVPLTILFCLGMAFGSIGCKKQTDEIRSGGGAAAAAPEIINPSELAGDWNGSMSNGQLLGMRVSGGKVTIIARGTISGDTVTWNYEYGSWVIRDGDGVFTATVAGLPFQGRFYNTTYASGTYSGLTWNVFL